MPALPPLLFSASGPVATPPATLNADLIALVSTMAPGYTAELPGSLIEDLSSTAVGALMTIDQARVDSVNSVAPGYANAYLLAALGAQFGVPQGLAANGSVFVVFTGSAGYVIPPGFLVSDGTNQYAIQDGGVIASGGTSSPLYAVATSANVFAIPPNSVTQIATSVPSPYTLTVTNALAGVPAQAQQTIESYQAQVLQAWQSPLVGWSSVLKGLLQKVPGVSPRLISIIPNSTRWEVIVGGGDPYQVAGAIYAGISSVGLLTGSSTTPRNVTVSIFDAPDTYEVVYVSPAQQEVTLAITWNTTLPSFTSVSSFNQYAINAGLAYLNGILVGQPINLLVLTEAIQQAVAPVLAAVNLTTLTFVVKYSGVTQSPTAGTSIIPAPDNETYLYASATDVTCVQG